MTETVSSAPGTGASHVAVHTEPDATPIVRLLARTLRDSIRGGTASDLAGRTATVAVRSHNTPQSATIAVAADGISVTSGVFVEPDAGVVVDLNARFAPAAEPEGDAALAAALLDALHPPIPDWRTAADSFWARTRSLRGVPDVLVAIAADDAGNIEQHVVGEGETQYLMASTPEALAGIFSGADDLIAVLSSGVLGLKGTLSQLSVMVGASWKVRFDV